MYDFSENIQRGILYLSKTDHEFYNEICLLVKPEYFEYPVHSKMYEGISEFFNKYHKLPNDEFLVEFCKEKKSEKEDISSYEDEIILINKIDPASISSKEYLIDSIEKFSRKEAMKAAIVKSVELMKRDRFGEIEEEVKKALLISRLQNFGQKYFEDVDDRWERILSVDDSDYIKTLIPSFDRSLSGGVRRKELAFVVAPPGVGKSIFLANQAVKCLSENLKVVYITLEMSEDRVAQRLDSISTLIPQKTLMTDGNFIKILKQRHKLFRQHFPKSNLRIKEFPTGTANIATVRSFLNQLRNYENYEPDVVIIDYLELLRPLNHGMTEYEAQQRIAEELRGLAMEKNILVWTATQTNRMGANVQVITDQHLGDSYGKIRVVDFAISLNQTDEEFDNGIMRAYVMKSRNGQAKFIVPIEVNYNTLQLREIHGSQENTETKNK